MHGSFGIGKMVIGKRIYTLIHFFCLFFIEGWGIERQPWIGNYFEFEWRNTLLYQTYPTIAEGTHLVRHSSSDFFLTTSLSNALDPQFSVELEATLAYTRRQQGGMDNFRLAGRYVWLDDIAGDPMSFTTGLVLTQSFVASLHDISSYHHGRSEAELFLSFGKENPLDVKWNSRGWGVLGIGIAERGSPWLRGDLTWEYRLCPQHEIKLFTHTLWGLGSKELHPRHFHGYGSIDHQSIDLGLGYTYLIDYFGLFSFEYSSRVYAKNFPAQTHRFLFRLTSTFGL